MGEKKTTNDKLKEIFSTILSQEIEKSNPPTAGSKKYTPHEDMYFTLEFDDGEVVDYIEKGVVEVKHKEYIVLQRIDDEDYLDFFRLEPVGEEDFSIAPIDNDREYYAVVDELNRNGYEILVEQ